MIILLRILLMVLPIILLVVWIRSRAKLAKDGEIPEEDNRRLRYILIASMAAMVAIGFGLKTFDNSDEAEGVYVPARVENGKVIPGHFEKNDENIDHETDKNKASQSEQDRG